MEEIDERREAQAFSDLLNLGTFIKDGIGELIMGEEWIEVAPLWKPRTEGSRLMCKGTVQIDLKAGEKVLLMRNDYATDENRQPQYRLMIVREDGDVHVDLETGDRLNTEIESND